MLHTHSLIFVGGEGISTYRYNSASFLLNVLVRGNSADFIRGCSWMDVGEGWQEGDGVEEIRLVNILNCCHVCNVDNNDVSQCMILSIKRDS